MSIYRGINGFAVQNYSSNPTLLDGQVWYNSTSKNLQLTKFVTAAWSTSGNLPQAGLTQVAGTGTQTSMLSFNGQAQPPNQTTTNSQSYDGSTWTAQAQMNTSRQQSTGSGISNTSVLAFSGRLQPAAKSAATESYNGSWTTQPNMGRAEYNLGGAGTGSAAIAFGAYSGGTVYPTESYNGSWTAGNPMSVGRSRNKGFGSSATSALTMGGENGSGTNNNTESWNGTNWTSVGVMNNARYAGAASSGSAATDGLIAGGRGGPPSLILTSETWNGSSWTNGPSLLEQSALGAGAGASGSSAAICGGTTNSPGNDSNKTQNFNSGALVVEITST